MKPELELMLERHLPLGLDGVRELKWLAWGGAASIAYSLSFLVRYSNRYQSLFLYNRTSKVLNTDAVMPDFVEVLGSSLIGFLILALCMAAVILYHYAYHHQGSKSIYLMKRLPSRWELHRRCVTLPLLVVIACFCAALLLLLIYFAVYMAVTPKACLSPDQWRKLWNVLLGVPV